MATLRPGAEHDSTARSGQQVAGAEPDEVRHLGWGDLAKGFLAVHVASAAQRVLERREEAPESGRLGGEAGAAVASRPAAVPRRSARTDTEPVAAPENTETAPAGVWPLAKRVFQEFGKDNGSLLAASVAFYLMLSLVPLILVAISIFGIVLGGSQEAQTKVLGFLWQFFPGQPQMKEMIEGAVHSVIEKRGVIGGVGLAGLILTATGGFATLENAINIVWNAPSRNFLWSKLFSFLMMLVVGALFLFSFGLTAVAQWAGNLPGLDRLAGNWLARGLALVLPIGVSGLMFAVIYRFYPNGRSGWKPSLIAGFVTAVLWELFKNGYAFYSARFAHQEATYGTLAGFVGLVLWIYYSSALVLLGSELTWVLEGCPKLTRDRSPGNPTK